MPDPIYPGAVWRPGVNADNGQTSMESVVCHYTVGRDSRPIGDRGYFHFLVSRDGTVTQFARANAVCWHAGQPWNERGPGIEVEYLPGADDDVFTPAAWIATGQLDAWLHNEWGVPLAFHDGPRLASWNGFITHRSLIQTGDAHSDYWPDLPIGGGPTTSTGGNSVYHMIIDGPAAGNPRTFKVDGLQILSEIAYGDPRGAYGIHQEALDAVAKYGIPLVDGRQPAPFGKVPLIDLCTAWSAGGWKPTAGTPGAPAPTVLTVKLTGTATPG